MSVSQEQLNKPPNSPPMAIPPRKRSVFNSFFPEPRRKNIVTRLNFVKGNKLEFTTLKQELKNYTENLHIFTELQKGEKLGKQEIIKIIKKDNEKLKQNNDKLDDTNTDEKEIIVKKYYKQTPHRGMWLSRWWYSESREKTINYLDEDFTKLMNYLDRILNNLKCDPTGIYVNLVNQIREFIDKIIPGLYNLKQTYPSVIKLVAKVDSIILTLLDFKEKTDNYLERKQQNVRLTVKSKKIPIYVEKSEYNDMPPNSV